ncbi:MAG TPA: M14 family zinc carboxypeptidase [Blastocatellia bacterium]|nr:M14 family zinc carboxypeptidase [Blastocatellia bacterium]
MTERLRLGIIAAALALAFSVSVAVAADKPGRDPKQPVDKQYTEKIHEYTTAPYFTSPLVDYLPASSTVPTPESVLGDIAGAPGKLPYSAGVYKYMRMLEKASSRVKVYSIGTTEEGREMIAVAVSSEANIAKIEENRQKLAKLADPRTIGLNDEEAEKIVSDSVPVYYITGTIHSPETGAPTALMEMAYRLAVDDSPYIKTIRDNVITLITPVVEVDGRDRMVDIYNWHLAHPKENWPPLMYWGHYVAHDNNRDAMGLSLKLSENVLNTYLGWKAQVLHDLHESVPYLYDNTIGDEPYNAWLDPILTNEWQMMGWKNVADMTGFGMPGVFTHGNFDTWSPGYLMFMAATHNGISRLYETFGNGGADTVERTLDPEEYERAWYRQDPPLPKALWSQRDNNNYEQTGLLVSLHYFADNKELFLHNFYRKSKRSILKPKNEGPAAYVLPGNDPRPALQAQLVQLLQKQGCEIHRATAPFTVMVPKQKKAEKADSAGESKEESAEGKDKATQKTPESETEPREFPAGSYIVRMDQPYCRIADTLLDYQYWSPDDPQKQPYDDTGWTFGELYNVQVVRVTDIKVLDARMQKVTGAAEAPNGVTGSGQIIAVNNEAEPALIQLRYRLNGIGMEVAEEPFESAGHKFNRGSFLIQSGDTGDVKRAVSDLGLRGYAIAEMPTVKTHPARAPRIAILHTWLDTQDEGWWRMAFDKLKIPYTYISTQQIGAEPDLNSKFDVILFPPVGRGQPQAIVSGLPMWGNPLPWKTTELTPNIGKEDSTDDIRPGLGWSGLAKLQSFVREGGLLVTVDDSADFAVHFGLAEGVSVAPSAKLKLVGTVVKSNLVDAESPIAYGYDNTVSTYSFQGPIFNLSNTAFGGPGPESKEDERATGRGTKTDPDVPQGRASMPPPPRPHAEPWQALGLTDEQKRNGLTVIPPIYRPRVVFRYADLKDLLVSGLLDGGSEIAQHAEVIDVPVEKGHVVLFSNNPIWRGETIGSYSMVFNAIMNFDSLNAGRTLDEK